MAERQTTARAGRLVLAGAGGLALSCCFLEFSLWPLAWLALAPVMLAAALASSLRAAVAVGFVSGLGANVPAFHWLVATIHHFGGFPLPVAASFYFGLSLYSSLQFVLFAVLVRRSGFGFAAAAPALLWVAVEFLFPNLFPWRLAYTQRDLIPLLQIGEWTGPYGLSLAMAWVSSGLARVLAEGGRAGGRSLAAATAVAVALYVVGWIRVPQVDRMMQAAPVIRVGLVQGNLSIEEKGNVRFFESNLATYRRGSLEVAEEADVVIWPETVISEPLPRTLRQLPRGAAATLGLRRPLLGGALTYAGPPEAPLFYNSVMLFDEEGRVLGLSDKQILMPFGETMPFASVFPWLRELSPQTGDFQAGNEVVLLDVPGVGRFAPLNCYEDLKAAIARGATRDGAEVLFAVANDAWFGNTMAPFQHEALALWRAVENRRFLVRVTNTGVSDVIDAAGRVVLRLPVFEPATAVAAIRRLDVRTPYTGWGDLFAWLVLGAGLLTLVARRSSRADAQPGRPV